MWGMDQKTELIKLGDYLCRCFNIEVGDITRTRFMGKVAKAVQIKILEGKVEDYDLYDSKVFMSYAEAEEWREKRKESLTKQINELKEGV